MTMAVMMYGPRWARFSHFCNELGLRDLKKQGEEFIPKSNFVFVKDEEGPNVAEN